MEKFLNIPVYKLLANGTTDDDGTPTDLIDQSADFVAAGVQVGDIVHNSTDNTYHTVTSVTATELGVTGGGVGDAKAYFIHSATINNSQLVSCSEVSLIEQASTSTITITYDGASATDVITLTHTPVAAGSEYVRDLLQSETVSALQTKWKDVSHDVNILPFKVIGISIG